jgi:hypothetical protein
MKAQGKRSDRRLFTLHKSQLGEREFFCKSKNLKRWINIYKYTRWINQPNVDLDISRNDVFRWI